MQLENGQMEVSLGAGSGQRSLRELAVLDHFPVNESPEPSTQPYRIHIISPFYRQKLSLRGQPLPRMQTQTQISLGIKPTLCPQRGRLPFAQRLPGCRLRGQLPLVLPGGGLLGPALEQPGSRALRGCEVSPSL